MRKPERNRFGIVLLALLIALAPVVSPARVSAADVDVIFDGTVSLSPGKTFQVEAYNSGGGTYAVDEATPLGALQAAVSSKGLTYDITDKNYEASGALLLDNIGSHVYIKGGSRWYAYVNGILKDGFNNPEGALNLIELKDGDKVEFYFAAGISDGSDFDAVKAAATAAVKTVASLGSPVPGDESDWTLQLSGARNRSVDKDYFERGLVCGGAEHGITWTDDDGNVWGGVPLWLLVGMVDDNPDMGSAHYNFDDELVASGYKVKIVAGDGWSTTLESDAIARNDGYIVANTLNGQPLPELTGSGKASWPLHLKGQAVKGNQQVGNIVKIELVDLPQETEATVPQLHIAKYDTDQTTIVKEMTVDYLWMEENLPVIGDGVTKYRYEGITNDPGDVWDEAETYPGGFKLENAVKGTRISDLCDLVGGMGSGTEIVLVAKDGYETRLPYSSIYADPAVFARQGDAILAWWADGEYVPDYSDGMRLFFTPGGDNVYGQWDMHETLSEKYWHYYYSGLDQYPSCAGLSAKYITQIKIYSVPAGDWTLVLDGEDIGGLKEDINKTYFEQALACQFGADHKASYTDSKGRVWEGIPLWFLVGFVDDADKHSSDSFDQELAEAGYTVEIIAADGYSVKVASQEIIRNDDFIVANMQDGAAIPESDKNWPLRLVGPVVKGSDSIGNVVSIRLLKADDGLTDIRDHWAREDIERLVGLGAVTGYPDKSFKPDADITRAEFVTVLTKAFGLDEAADNGFSDTEEHWAKKHILAAASAGVVEGYGDGTFGPDDKVTREQVAVMVARLLELEPTGGETAFDDNDSISDWAAGLVVTATDEQILLGYPDNTFRPQANATRAEAVTVIVKALDN